MKASFKLIIKKIMMI